MRFGISISHGVVGGGSTAVTSWETPPQQYAEGGILRQLPSARCGRGGQIQACLTGTLPYPFILNTPSAEAKAQTPKTKRSDKPRASVRHRNKNPSSFGRQKPSAWSWLHRRKKTPP